MAQKFVSLDDAANQLGISKDRLGELREAGKVRAYRDGASWKFRTDDVEKLAAEGIPSGDPGMSDVSLDAGEELAPLSPSAGSSDLDLDLGLDEPSPSAASSDIELDDLEEPTVPVEGTGDDGDDEVLGGSADDDLLDISDSILLSETELGESTNRPPSTIIGKAEMSADLDLDLATSDSDAASSGKPSLKGKDSRQNAAAAESKLDLEPPSATDNFDDLEELEIDLEAESSRILAPEDVAKAKAAAKPKSAPKAAEFSDLELAPSDSSPGALDSGLGSGIGGSAALSGLSSLELEGSSDDDVLGDGSDITLSSESSGINIISPSDSGLALDEVPLELSGISGRGSSLDLGQASDAEVDLEPLDLEAEEAAASKGGEPFALTPFGEETGEDDSSQIIPLDEVSEEDAAGALLGAAGGEGEGLGDDFASAGLVVGTVTPLEAASESTFTGWHVFALSMCVLLLTLSGMMVVDLVRNMWSWDQVYNVNSTIMDALLKI